MRLLFLGDVVGHCGCEAVEACLPGIIEEYQLDFIVINGENAADGFGITEAICSALCNSGADVLSGGNHSWSRREALVFIERQQHLLRPLNFPPASPGCGSGIFRARNGAQVLVINVIGRVFMSDVNDPFAAVERELQACPLGKEVDAIIIDFHAEATSEKQAMACFVDGTASLVVGTHTHVPTADHRVLPNGTAAMTDVGMCGNYDSIIGMNKDESLQRFLHGTASQPFKPANGLVTLSGVAVDIDDHTGLAKAISPLRMGGYLEEIYPSFW